MQVKFVALANAAAAHPFTGDGDYPVHEDVVALTHEVLLAIGQVGATVRGKTDPVSPWLTGAMYQIASAGGASSAVGRAMIANGWVAKWQAGRLKTSWFAENKVTTTAPGPLAVAD